MYKNTHISHEIMPSFAASLGVYFELRKFIKPYKDLQKSEIRKEGTENRNIFYSDNCEGEGYI